MRNVLIFDFLLVSLYQVVTARFFLNNCGSACWHIYCFITLPVPGEKWNLPPLSLSLPPLPPSADSNKADAAQTYIYRHNGTRRTIFFWTHSEVCIKKWLRYWGMHQLLLQSPSIWIFSHQTIVNQVEIARTKGRLFEHAKCATSAGSSSSRRRHSAAKSILTQIDARRIYTKKPEELNICSRPNLDTNSIKQH